MDFINFINNELILIKLQVLNKSAIAMHEGNAFIMRRSGNRSNLSHIGVAELDYSIRDKIGVQQKMVDLDYKNQTLNRFARSKTESFNPTQVINMRKDRSMSSKMLTSHKQYQKKLPLSSKSWLVYDYRKRIDKRGWRILQADQMTGALKILLVKIFIQLEKQDENIGLIQVKVNQEYLRQEISLNKIRKLSPSKRSGQTIQYATKRCLDSNTVIKMADLITGVFLTDFDDIVEYATIFLGYLCFCKKNQIKIIPKDSHFYYAQQIAQALSYRLYLGEYINFLFLPSHLMTSSKFNPLQISFNSSTNDICKLFSQYKIKIFSNKFQNIKKKFVIFAISQINNFMTKGLQYGKGYSFFGHWRGLNGYTTIVLSRELNILIILRQCKFEMVGADLKAVQKWVRDIRREAGDKMNIKAPYQNPKQINKLSSIKLIIGLKKQDTIIRSVKQID